MKPKALLLSGGINHDYVESSAALAACLAEDFDIEVFPEIDAGLSAFTTGSFDLLVLNTLRWRMLDDDKYIPFREEWAYEMPLASQQQLLNFVAEGGGVLALHTASICFDTFAEWQSILGGGWRWGQTFHPEPETVACVIADGDHPVTAGLEDFRVVDEVYHNLEVLADSHVLLTTPTSQDGRDQVLVWANHYGKGRVVYSALGHDGASISQATHSELLRRSARWCGRIQ